MPQPTPNITDRFRQGVEMQQRMNERRDQLINEWSDR